MRMRNRAHIAVTLGLCGGIVLNALPTAAYPRPGRIYRVDVVPDGPDVPGDSYHPSISANGRYLAFTSYKELLPEDTNRHSDVYVKDLATGKLEIASRNNSGELGENDSSWPSISADGRMVAYSSSAINLVPGDTNGVTDIFVRDLEAETTARASTFPTGGEAVGSSSYPQISANGRYVSFISYAHLHPDDENEFFDVFVKDLQTGSVDLISGSRQGLPHVLHASDADISGDGNIVAWAGRSPTSDPPDVNGIFEDVFVTDRAAGTTRRISNSSLGMQGLSHSVNPAVSDDGRAVAFQSLAPNLAPQDGNGFADIFVYDIPAGRLERVSVSSNGAEGDYVSSSPFISSTGRYVMFGSGSSNLTPDPDGNGVSDVFLHDRLAGTTELISRTPEGTTSNGMSIQSSISADGSTVVFGSMGSNLVPGDKVRSHDLFAHERGPAVGAGHIEAKRLPDGYDVTGWARFGAQVVASATDFTGEAVPPGYADLAAGRLIHRPEEGDLLFEVDLASLPDTTPLADGLHGAPTIYYSLSVTIGGTPYVVAVTPAPEDAPTQPRFVLSKCASQPCTSLGPIQGSYGVTGAGFLVSLPLSSLGVGSSAVVNQSSIQANQRTLGTSRTADSLSLGGGTIGATTVAIGTAAPDTPVEDVTFPHAAAVESGRFSGFAPEGAGTRDVWIRTCVGQVCGLSKRST